MESIDFTALERRRRNQIFSAFSYFIIAFLGIFTIVDLLIERYLIAGVLSLLLCLTIANYILAKRTGNLDRAGTFVLLPYMAFTWTIFYEGGIEQTGPLWSYFIPVFAFYLKGAAKGIVYLAVQMLGLLIIFFLALAGVIDEVYTGLQFTIIFGSYLALSTFLLIFENVRQQYAESARSASSSLIKANRELQLLSTRDFLTGANNRRHISSILETEIQRYVRYQAPLSAVLADLDQFKTINDTFGYDFGDLVLREFVNQTQASLRITDSLGRFGGEEFLIVLPDTGIEAAMLVAERIRDRTAGIEIKDGHERNVKPTVSMGVGQFKKGESLEDFLKRLDQALYRAKDNGRNRCISAD
jgi:diguanylate cyclase (GGDEF)-like protein